MRGLRLFPFFRAGAYPDVLEELSEDLKTVDPWAGAQEVNPYWSHVRITIDEIANGLPYADKEGTLLRQGRGIPFTRFNKKLKCAELYVPRQDLVAQIWMKTRIVGLKCDGVGFSTEFNFTVVLFGITCKEAAFIDKGLSVLGRVELGKRVTK